MLKRIPFKALLKNTGYIWISEAKNSFICLIKVSRDWGLIPNTEAQFEQKSSVWSTWFLCLVPEIEIPKLVSYPCLLLSKAGKINDEFRFAYCGMNHSDNLDPILFLVYSLSFNHRYHSYFIIMTLLSNERIISCMGLFKTSMIFICI